MKTVRYCQRYQRHDQRYRWQQVTVTLSTLSSLFRVTATVVTQRGQHDFQENYQRSLTVLRSLTPAGQIWWTSPLPTRTRLCLCKQVPAITSIRSGLSSGNSMATTRAHCCKTLACQAKDRRNGGVSCAAQPGRCRPNLTRMSSSNRLLCVGLSGTKSNFEFAAFFQ